MFLVSILDTDIPGFVLYNNNFFSQHNSFTTWFGFLVVFLIYIITDFYFLSQSSKGAKGIKPQEIKWVRKQGNEGECVKGQ